MAVNLIWHGHGTWSIHTESHKILLDPFFSGNPAADIGADEAQADAILLSHGHGDHVGDRGNQTYDVVEIAKRTGAHVVASYEIANWLQRQGVEKCTGMNLGGKLSLEFGTVRMVPALHSNSLPDGSYGGMPAGFVLELGHRKVYFACDTALFSDMRLVGDLGIDAAVLPIGDLFTMGVDDSLLAVKFIQPKHVLPAHYGTWPPIAQDAQAWAAKIRSETSAIPHVLSPGQKFHLD